MTTDEVKELVSFMRNNGVASFRVGDLAVEFDAGTTTAPVFAEQSRMAAELSRTIPNLFPVDPEVEPDEGYSDDDLFASA